MNRNSAAAVRLRGDAFQQRRREPRFTDPRLAGKQDDLAFAGLGPRPAPQQQFELFFPPDERGKAARVQRLEAALRGTRPQRCPGPRRTVNALKVDRPEVLQFEEIAEKFSRPLGDDDHVGLSDPLQARREAWGLAADATLLRLPRSDQIADND